MAEDMEFSGFEVYICRIALRSYPAISTVFEEQYLSGLMKGIKINSGLYSNFYSSSFKRVYLTVFEEGSQ